MATIPSQPSEFGWTPARSSLSLGFAAATIRRSLRGSTRWSSSPTKVARTALVAVVADEVAPGSRVLVTGRRFREFVALPSLTEPEAVEHALGFVVDGTGARYDAGVSAGGETFMVYGLDNAHRSAAISTGNKCASGTGEFLLEQIRRRDARTPRTKATSRPACAK